MTHPRRDRLNLGVVKKRLWFLNFDADDELSRPSDYRPTRVVLARFEVLATRLQALVPPGDLVLAEWRHGGRAETRARSFFPRGIRFLPDAAGDRGSPQGGRSHPRRALTRGASEGEWSFILRRARPDPA